MKLIFCVAVLGLLATAANLQDPAPPKRPWNVRFNLKPAVGVNPADVPICAISVQVKASTEGEATILAFKYVQSWIMLNAQDQVVFYDVCEAKEK